MSAAVTADRATPLDLPGAKGRGWLVMWQIEASKLAAQLRVRVALGACLLGPVVFVLAMKAQDTVPADTLFGRWVHESGYADSLVVLGFSGQWVLPILVAIVAGDISAGEDRHRTWTLLLTRSRTRADVLSGKVLAVAAYSVLMVAVLGASSLVAGLIGFGSRPLVSLSGALLPPAQASHEVLLSWTSVLAPTLAMAAIALLVSVLSRNSWVGVIVPVVLALFLNLVSLVSAVDPIRPYLPTTGFLAWYGLVRTGTYVGPVLYSVAVSAAWIFLCVALAALVVTQRDVVDA